MDLGQFEGFAKWRTINEKNLVIGIKIILRQFDKKYHFVNYRKKVVQLLTINFYEFYNFDVQFCR